MVAVYIHIPYCRTICPYCDFVKRPIQGAAPDAYTAALCREIDSYCGPKRAVSVFLGGGTPSLLSLHGVEAILAALYRRFILDGAEITLEANPDDVTGALMAGWKQLGVNRVSLGVQSFDDQTLQYLGRRHDAASAHRACDIVAAHFDTWNIDLMFGAQPVSKWPHTLAVSVAHAPHHVSAYGLTYEAGTPFGKRSDEAIDDDTYLALYHETVETLSQHAIERYEVSNFAQAGHECRHNLVYWKNGAYAGFGTGAYSYIGGVRARNHVRTEDYLARPGEKSEALPIRPWEERVETLIQHLRLADGLTFKDYQVRFGTHLDDDFGSALAELAGRGLVIRDAERVRPSDAGFDLNNEIGLALVNIGAPIRA